MAKRFTDNEKWKDAWFMDLPSKYKLFWLYLLDECNHAGIWKVNFKIATFYIGEHLEYSEVKRILKDRITILNDEYWYIDKFIKYQYKCDIQGLNNKNKAHLSILKLLNDYDIFKPLTSPLLGDKDKDKDKDKDSYSENYKKKEINNYAEDLFLENWKELRMHFLKQETFITKLDYFESNVLKIAAKTYTNDEINNALLGLFKQKNKSIKAMYLRPKHFLENIDKYLNAYLSNEFELYGSNVLQNKNNSIGGL